MYTSNVYTYVTIFVILGLSLYRNRFSENLLFIIHHKIWNNKPIEPDLDSSSILQIAWKSEILENHIENHWNSFHFYYITVNAINDYSIINT